MEIRVTGEEFLKALWQAMEDDILEERGPYGSAVKSSDIQWELELMARWLVKQYRKSRYEVSEDSD